MCIFCNRNSSKLTRHIKRCHKYNSRVKEVLKLNKNKRISEFKKMRRKGTVSYNKKEITKEKPCYQGERTRSKYQELERCSACKAFVSKRFF